MKMYLPSVSLSDADLDICVLKEKLTRKFTWQTKALGVVVLHCASVRTTLSKEQECINRRTSV